RLARYVGLYERGRREALCVGIIERASLLTPDELETWKDALDAEGYARGLTTMLREAGRSGAQRERWVGQQQLAVSERENDRLISKYQLAAFQGVDRPLTKDPKARVETGVFMIRKLFRSAESQRIARSGGLLGTTPPPGSMLPGAARALSPGKTSSQLL